MTTQIAQVPQMYQGQFGEFTITASDRTSVIVYRTGLALAAVSFALASAIALWNPSSASIWAISPLYTCFSLALGVSLLTIHIYMASLHRALQLFWLIGSLSALIIAYTDRLPFALTLYNQPLTLLGVGFTFAALTGIYFKEAFCFNRLETKILTPIVPVLLLGHLVQILPSQVEQILLATWAILFLVFALRKTFQAIPQDIGDKSVFTYLKLAKTH